MKKTLLLFAASLMTTALFATNALKVHSKTGDVVTYAFADEPVVTYQGSLLVLTTTTTSVEYPLSDVEKITFGDTDTAIDQIEMDGTPGNDQEVVIYSLNGNIVARHAIDAQGDSSFSLALLQNGTYVIKKGNTSYKIIKK